jgi:carbamoylphosphate synthase large subunit
MALREQGYETIMINSNPRRSPRLRHVGQAVLRAAHARGRAGDREARAADGRHRAARRADAAQAHRGLEAAGGDILGTSPDSIDSRRTAAASRRSRASSDSAAANGTVTSVERGARGGERIGYPVLVRPSTCSAAARCRSCYDAPSLRGLLRDGGARIEEASGAHRPVPRGCLRSATSMRSAMASAWSSAA